MNYSIENDISSKKKCTMIKTVILIFVLSIFFHFFALTNILHNYDSIHEFPVGYGVGISSGRWFLSILGYFIGEFWGNYNLPFFNGVIFLLIVSLSSVFIFDIFNIKSFKLRVLIGLAMTVFPSASSTLFFRYTSIYYGVGIFLSIFAVWIIDRYKYGYIGTIICIGFSLGIYQAYLPITISLFVLKLLKHSFNLNENFYTLLKKGLIYCLCLLLGLFIYYIILKILLNITGSSLSGYQGVSEMGQISVSKIPYLLLESLKKFILMPKTNYCSLATTKILKYGYVFIGLLSLYFILRIILNKNLNFGNITMIIFLLLAYPIAVNFIVIMCPNSFIYTLMVYSFFTVLIVPIILYSELCEIQVPAILRKLPIFIVIIMILNYVYVNNINYTIMYYADMQTINYLNSLITQVRMTDDFNSNLKWAIIGNSIDDPLINNIYANDDNIYGGNDFSFINSYSRYDWIEAYFGYSLPLSSQSEIATLKKNVTVQKMPCWPDEGSIKVIGENVVIKFENFE